MPQSNAGYGCRRDLRDARDYFWQPSPDDVPPAAVDLRANMPPVMKQLNIGSCTAHGVGAALRYIIRKHGNPDRDISRLQLYYDSREAEGAAGDDAGAEIRDVIKCARSIGVASEELWPYDTAKFKIKPPPEVYENAHSFTAVTYQRIEVGVDNLKVALMTGFPVVVGMVLYQSFESLRTERTGFVTMPDLHREKPVGGHCMIVAGYGQHGGYFTLRNSWGTDFGDQGDIYIPEQYIGSTSYSGDWWRITRTT